METAPAAAAPTLGSQKEGVEEFLTGFYRAFTAQDLQEMQKCYEVEWAVLTDKHFKNSSWPGPELVGKFVNDDQLFLTLYKEMYFRHVYAIGGSSVSMNDRVESFQNYHQLFKHVLTSNDSNSMELPNQWMWDIIDEFVYQYNDYSRYRTKLATQHRNTAGDDEDPNYAYARDHKEVWATGYVISILNELANKCDILEILEKDLNDPKGSVTTTEITHKSPKHLRRTLGYFALVGLLRVHALLGDYHAAIKAVDTLDFIRKDKIFAKVTSCYISLYYYAGFVMMMLQRYTDSFSFLQNLVQYISRVKNLHQKDFQFADWQKKNDQACHLLVMVAALSGKRLDESLLAKLRERLNETEKVSRIAQGDLDAFADGFKFAAPKFVTATTDFEDPEIGVADAMDLQKQLFMVEAQQQLQLEAIRCYLSLYSSISIAKLASFMEQETQSAEGGVPPEQFRTYLLQLKQRTREPVWRPGLRLSEGERQCTSSIDFYIDRDIVHIQSSRSQQNQQQSHAAYFIDSIRTLNQLQDEIARL